MALRDDFQAAVKTSMKAGTAPRTSTLRMILARLKDLDIAARPSGATTIPDTEIIGMLRNMVKSRRESVVLYEQGARPELAAKEEAEIAVITEFLPEEMTGLALDAAVVAAIANTGAVSVKDMGKVVAALKAAHGADLDMAKAGPLIKAKLGQTA